MRENNRKRLNIIQSYRGIAAILILISHVSVIYHDFEKYNFSFFYALNRSGGVDFFFVLSGFLIYYIYSRDFGIEGKAKEFIIKRLVRIYPLVWFFTLLSLPVYFLFDSFGNGHETQFTVILKSLLLLPQDQDPVLGATWSLVHVVLFYLIFTLYMNKKKTMKWIIITWTICILINNFYTTTSLNSQNYFINFLLSMFNLEFLIGCICAYLILKYNIQLKYSVLLIILGILGFLISWMNQYLTLGIDNVLFYGVSSALLIIGTSSIDRNYNSNIPKMFNVLGNASYSIIVTNLPIIILTVKVFNVLGVYLIIGYSFSVLLTIIVAIMGGVVVHFLIEKPLTRKLNYIIIKQSNRKGLKVA
ncbi:acyltransferase family protein [Halalkalibacter kiskunsagensis]|uniref:Acyltransferase family protein n=1 Tax=Halalkalibacter kiskunsagensis TaxID=1548599 RepID=A0ABV6KDM7_9BACI